MAAASSSFPAPLALSWTNPCFNADSSADSCASPTAHGDSLRDLALIRLKLVRFKFPLDTLSLEVPAGGRACRTDSVVVDLPDGSMGVVTAWAVDAYGHVACSSPSYVWALPARDFLPGLIAIYYDNEDFTAQYSSRIDSRIDFQWAQGAPVSGMGVDLFSCHWEGQIYFASPGTWSLHGLVEDGWRAWVNGTYVMNDFGVQNVHESTCQFTITDAGWYPIIVESHHHNGNAQMTLAWTPPGGAKVTVPAADFRR